MRMSSDSWSYAHMKTSASPIVSSRLNNNVKYLGDTQTLALDRSALKYFPLTFYSAYCDNDYSMVGFKVMRIEP
ncbi:hypothetical protein DPMN_095767 [Dreissena polymorpha]|uniref:Uncharacterized protein n=1 Tax=Dreissena polymorpha TaxID=45954 RepID=A0A9D4R373_DREPO|nr:hypothetical protein DPMN_095767 [Dreissena polymorpha]